MRTSLQRNHGAAGPLGRATPRLRPSTRSLLRIPDLWRVSWAILALAWVVPARAATISADLDGHDAQSSDLASRARALELDAQPGAFLSESEAVSRFQDYLYLHMVGDEQAAAEGFFALVTTGVLGDAGLHRDAEWYLAEALAGVENYKTAASRYRAIVDDPTHPFRDDAVRRLLEVHALSGDRPAFDALYQAEIASGRVQATGLITYSLGKSQYHRGDFAAAAAQFERVPVDNDWYGRARYFLGTIAVREDRLSDAHAEFSGILEQPIRTTDDRKVYDLALLALGRLAYQDSRYADAAEYYNRVGPDSPSQADKLYEIVWTSIRQERWHDALNNVDVFLLAYPDHPYTGQLKILRGHLSFHEHEWDTAIGEYEDVIRDYAPVQSRFEALARPGSDAEGAVRAVIERRPELVELPSYVVSMMHQDPDLSRAIDVFSDLEAERQQIEASEALIAQLRAFIDGAGAIGSFERHRADALVLSDRALAARVSLLEVHERWLAGLGDPAIAGKLEGLGARRRDLAARVDALGQRVAAVAEDLERFERTMGGHHAEADGARRDAATLEREIHALRGELAAAKREGKDATALAERLVAAEADLAAAHLRAEQADQRMAELHPPASLDSVSAAEVDALGDEAFGLAAEYQMLRDVRPGELEGDRVQLIGQELENTFSRLGRVRDDTADSAGAEVPGIRDRFRIEVAAVAEERRDYEKTLNAARDVSLDLTRSGFGRLEDFFADAVMKADMGIVDAFWARKLDVDQELERVRQEREAQLLHLEERFRLIREKMGDAR